MADYQATLAELNLKLAQNPDNGKVLAQRGETYRLLKFYPEALADFTRAIELNPNYAWALAHRGETYYQIESFEAALADFNQSIKFNPDNAWALAHRGVTYERIECFEAALADLNRAIELNPQYAWAIAYRGRAYEMMRCYEETLVNFKQALDLDKTIIKDAVTELGLILSFLGRYAEAMEYYEQSLQEDPDNNLTLYCIAFTKVRWQGLAASQAEIDKARALLQSKWDKEERSTIIYELGGLAALEGKTEEALNYLQEAMSLDYMPRRRALHDLAWLDLYSNPRFQELIGEVL